MGARLRVASWNDDNRLAAIRRPVRHVESGSRADDEGSTSSDPSRHRIG
jgi:hypothetical protein